MADRIAKINRAVLILLIVVGLRFSYEDNDYSGYFRLWVYFS
jgi:hypothetical protein